MKKINRIFITILLITISFTLVSCKKEDKKKEALNLDIYVDLKDKYSLKLVDLLVKEYEEKNKNIKVKVVNGMEEKDGVLKEFESGKNIDIIIGNRDTAISLNKKGFLGEIQELYNSEELNKKFYEVYNSYGRILDKYYAVEIIPYTVEFVYNKEALTKLGVQEPKDFMDYIKLLKLCSDKNIEVPYILNEDLSIYEILFSIFLDESISGEDLVRNYTDKKEEYMNYKGLEATLKEIEKYKKEGYMKEEIFKKIDEKEIDYFLKGDHPIMITTSFFADKVNRGKVDIIKSMGQIGDKKIIRPVYSNTLISSTVNGINKERKEDFLKFVVSEDFQNKLKDLGYITGNKESNKSYSGLKGEMVENLFESNSSNIIYKDNLPKDIGKAIENSIRDILKGNYKENYLKEEIKK